MLYHLLKQKTSKAYLKTHFFSTLDNIGEDDGTDEEEEEETEEEEEDDEEEEETGMNYNSCVVLASMVGQPSVNKLQHKDDIIFQHKYLFVFQKNAST